MIFRSNFRKFDIFQHLPIFFQKIVLTQTHHRSSLYQVRNLDIKIKLTLLSPYLFSFNNENLRTKSSLIFCVLFPLVLKAKIHNLFI